MPDNMICLLFVIPTGAERSEAKWRDLFC